jgi:hypothetical protein
MISETQRAFWNKYAPFDGVYGLGDQFAIAKTIVRGTYSFAVSGGAVSTISLLDQAGDVIVLPDNAIITQVYIDIVTAMTSTGGTGTIALTANSSGDLLAAVDADTLSGVVAGVPVGTAATMVKLTADRTLSVAIATAALTAGKFNAFVEYVLSE